MLLSSKLKVWYTWTICFLYDWELYWSVNIEEPLKRQTRVVELLLWVIQKQFLDLWDNLEQYKNDDFFKLISKKIPIRQVNELLWDFTPLKKEEYENLLKSTKENKCWKMTNL